MSSPVETATFALGVLAPLLALFLYREAARARRRKRGAELDGQHVLISGGSSGIGLAVAKEAVARGAHCTLISRGGASLEAALAALGELPKGYSQKIQGLSLDVTAGSAAVTAAIRDLEGEGRPIDVLINCAGAAICGRAEELTDDECRHLLDLNYNGTLWLTRAVLPGMKRRKKGRILFTSTGAALIGIYGYSVYGATKWAVRGLGEALIHELTDTGVTLTIAFPPDTDTPGLVNENKRKPPETKIISESGGIYKPEKVGLQLLNDTLAGKPYSCVGLETSMLLLLCCLTPRGIFTLIKQYFLMGTLRLVYAFYQYYFYRVIVGMKKKRESNKKAE